MMMMVMMMTLLLMMVMMVMVMVMVMVMMMMVVFVEAHLTVLLLDVLAMKLKNFRKDIEINDDQLYERCLRDDVVSAEVRSFVCGVGLQIAVGLGVV